METVANAKTANSFKQLALWFTSPQCSWNSLASRKRFPNQRETSLPKKNGYSANLLQFHVKPKFGPFFDQNFCWRPILTPQLGI